MGSVPSYGDGNMLLKLFADLNSIMVREADTPSPAPTERCPSVGHTLA